MRTGNGRAGKFLKLGLGAAMVTLGVTANAQNSDNSAAIAALDREVFSLGVATGVLNIENFGSEWLLGLSGTFQASEDFFLQYNYLEAEAALSSFEKSQGAYFSGDHRRFRHYDLLVGYKLFQAEIYPGPGNANLSSFYIVGGVGDTRFGGEDAFTYTYGLGYEASLTRRISLNADYRIYRYDSRLVTEAEKTADSVEFSVGLNYLF